MLNKNCNLSLSKKQCRLYTVEVLLHSNINAFKLEKLAQIQSNNAVTKRHLSGPPERAQRDPVPTSSGPDHQAARPGDPRGQGPQDGDERVPQDVLQQSLHIQVPRHQAAQPKGRHCAGAEAGSAALQGHSVRRREGPLPGRRDHRPDHGQEGVAGPARGREASTAVG